MADYEKAPSKSARGSIGEDVAFGADDASAIPKGTIDPVYEAKARVLNRAVRFDRPREASVSLLA